MKIWIYTSIQIAWYICTTITRYPIFSTRYSVMCKVYTGYCGTSEIEHGLCTCTVDNPLAKARGLSLRTGAQTMLYLSLVMQVLFRRWDVLLSKETYVLGVWKAIPVLHAHIVMQQVSACRPSKTVILLFHSIVQSLAQGQKNVIFLHSAINLNQPITTNSKITAIFLTLRNRVKIFLS